MPTPPGEKIPYNFCEVTKTKSLELNTVTLIFFAMIRHNDQGNL